MTTEKESNRTIDSVQSLFETLDPSAPLDLSGLYLDEAEFRDPVVHLKGRTRIEKYMNALMRTLGSCRFEFSDRVVQGDSAMLAWTMRATLRFPPGKEVSVDGCTLLKVDSATGMVALHRDYFDLSWLLLQSIPVVSALARKFRNPQGG